MQNDLRHFPRLDSTGGNSFRVDSFATIIVIIL
jgi:hypothetical protein